MIQTVAICHRWIRRPPVPRLRTAFLRETRAALEPERGSELDQALTAGVSASDHQIRLLAAAVTVKIKKGTCMSYLISWGFLEAQDKKPKGRPCSS